ncbi:hypothetical protein NFHSH190041_03370 [Shewanella sp. NFH-SH190041]|nr:hypothetical protein NFHSH190041_03370 [Shewanella sp. NFH-SH190041]
MGAVQISIEFIYVIFMTIILNKFTSTFRLTYDYVCPWSKKEAVPGGGYGLKGLLNKSGYKSKQG